MRKNGLEKIIFLRKKRIVLDFSNKFEVQLNKFIHLESGFRGDLRGRWLRVVGKAAQIRE